MSGIFSFIKHPILGLLEISNRLVPGLEKAIALYYDGHSGTLKCTEINSIDEDLGMHDFFIDDLNAAQKLRTRKIQTQWMATHNLPFETKKTVRKQLSIFDELNNVVLCVGYLNPFDNQSDLVFLFFNHNKGNFGLSKSNDSLTTDEKSIIGAIVYNSLKVFLHQQTADSETLRHVNRKVNKLEEENQDLHQKMDAITKNYNGSLVEMCQYHLKALSGNFGVTFRLASDTVEKLQLFSGQMDELKQILTDAATLALNLNFGQPNSIIELKPWDIIFREPKSAKQTEKYEVADRYLKTFGLLNKLENAAGLVVKNQKRLTSTNVGNACPTPISAPAISDALKNHQKKLISLLNDYPDKWPIIRNEFRPVKNILTNSQAG